MGDHDDVVAVEDRGEARLLRPIADALAGRLDDGRDHVRAEIGRRQLHDARRQPEGAAVARRHAETGEGVERPSHAGLGQIGGPGDVAQGHVMLLAPECPDDPQAARKGFQEIGPVAARRPPLRIFRPQSRHLGSPNPSQAFSAQALSASTSSVTASPTAAARVAGHSTLNRRPAVSTVSERRGPRKVPPTTLPGQASCPAAGGVSGAPKVTSSGRTITKAASPRSKAWAARHSPRPVAPSTARRCWPSSPFRHAVTAASIRLGVPKKLATSRLAGRRYTVSGSPIWRMRPFCITTTRSDSAIASSWSWVT